MARSTSLVSLLAMKLWTKSSIHGCQARLPRAIGAFLFGSVGLGVGLSSGVGVFSGSVGEGRGVTGIGEGDIGATMMGVVAVGLGETGGTGFDFLDDRFQTVKAS